MARDAEAQIRKNSLPGDPTKYDVKLPQDFQAPQGITFQFDQNDPMLAKSRELAHKRGLTQEEYSDFLGVYAATKISEHQQLSQARDAQKALLGSAADSRIAQIETWLRGRVGTKADGLVAQLKNFPVAAYVEAFEELARQFSHQGGASAPAGGRVEPDNSGRIAGYETMTFEQRRAAQDAAAGRTITPAGRMPARGR